MKVTELNNYAIGVGDIAEALRSSSANLAMTNTTLEQSVGLITASYEVLQDSGRVGNGLKTISMRVQGYSKELEAMGVSVYDATGKVRSLFDIMKDASQVFDNLKAMGKDAQAYSLVDKLG